MIKSRKRDWVKLKISNYNTNLEQYKTKQKVQYKMSHKLRTITKSPLPLYIAIEAHGKVTQ